MRPLNLLVYSPSGTGKTHFIGTAAGDARLTPALLLDFDGGVLTIESKVADVTVADLGKNKTSGKIDLFRITKWDDFEVIYNWLIRHPDAYKLVAIDSLTEVHNLNLATAVEYSKRTSRGHDPDIPERQDYQRSLAQMRKMIRYFRDLPCHVVFTATTKDLEDPLTRQFKSHPSVLGQLIGELPAFFDAVGYLGIDMEDKDERQRVLVFKSNNRVEAKIRVEGGGLDSLKGPTLPRLLDALADISKRNAEKGGK